MEEIIKQLKHTIEYFKDDQTDFQRGRVFEAKKILKALLAHNNAGQSEQLHLCPVCNEIAGKSYLLSRLPTICRKCDHAWNRA